MTVNYYMIARQVADLKGDADRIAARLIRNSDGGLDQSDRAELAKAIRDVRRRLKKPRGRKSRYAGRR